ncbi:hypothetical protein LEMLEM_LOCUS20209, partial [Lemmus lemmus]
EAIPLLALEHASSGFQCRLKTSPVQESSATTAPDHENQWNPSRLIWFDGPRSPGKVTVNTPQNTLPNKKQEAVWRELC